VAVVEVLWKRGEDRWRSTVEVFWLGNEILTLVEAFGDLVEMHGEGVLVWSWMGTMYTVKKVGGNMKHVIEPNETRRKKKNKG